MRQTFLIIAAAVTFFAALPTLVSAQEYGISTGGSKGTYYAFGQDLARVTQKEGVKLNVLTSQGSIENLYRILKAPEAQLAIVQHDTLFWMQDQKDEVAQGIAKKTKLILPLFNEEVHIIARAGANITEIEHLTGKKVAIGKAGSGTSVTAETLLRIGGIKPGEKVNKGGADALNKLKQGEIDAMFYVAGAPVKLFNEEISASDNLNLVSITNKDITEIYQINPILDDYNWTKDGVRTVAVKAVLVTYDYLQGGRKCTFVRKVAGSLWNNLDELKNSGHPKWKTVKLEAKVKGWQDSNCVANLQSTTSSTSGKKAGYPAWLKKLKDSAK